jgi:hypothetical protein
MPLEYPFQTQGNKKTLSSSLLLLLLLFSIFSFILLLLHLLYCYFHLSLFLHSCFYLLLFLTSHLLPPILLLFLHFSSYLFPPFPPVLPYLLIFLLFFLFIFLTRSFVCSPHKFATESGHNIWHNVKSGDPPGQQIFKEHKFKQRTTTSD